MAALTVFGIANCDTVKRARTWLTGQAIAHHFHDFKKAGVPAERLDTWLASSGWKALLNRRGTAWWQLDVAVQAGVADSASARSLMLAQSSVIKRPVVEWPGGAITVGFDAEQWAARHCG